MELLPGEEQLHVIYSSALQSFCHRGTPDIRPRLSWNPH